MMNFLIPALLFIAVGTVVACRRLAFCSSADTSSKAVAAVSFFALLWQFLAIQDNAALFQALAIDFAGYALGYALRMQVLCEGDIPAIAGASARKAAANKKMVLCIDGKRPPADTDFTGLFWRYMAERNQSSRRFEGDDIYAFLSSRCKMRDGDIEDVIGASLPMWPSKHRRAIEL